MQMFLLQAMECTFGGASTGDWISINVLVILATVLIASVVYTFANLMPTVVSERLKRGVKFEYVQAILSAMILVVIFALLTTSCDIVLGMTGQPPFAFAQGYVGSLLFIKGQNLLTNVYSTSVQFAVYGGVVDSLAGNLASLLPQFQPQIILPEAGSVAIIPTPSSAFGSMYANYAWVLYGIFTPLVVSTFGMLLLQFLTLPVISALGLTVLLPVALAVRSLGFTGPRLREAADSFLALAIALYFIYPLTFVMDNQIISWLYCTNGATPCNPYAQYTGKYQLNELSASSFFAEKTFSAGTVFGYGGLSLPSNFYSPAFGAGFSMISNIWNGLVDAPGVVNRLAVDLAEYLFEGIVLMALDLAITVGLAIGLQRGISAGLSFLGGGSIWGA